MLTIMIIISFRVKGSIPIVIRRDLNLLLDSFQASFRKLLFMNDLWK